MLSSEGFLLPSQSNEYCGYLVDSDLMLLGKSPLGEFITPSRIELPQRVHVLLTKSQILI